MVRITLQDKYEGRSYFARVDPNRVASIGRDPKNDVMLYFSDPKADKRISRKHCVVFLDNGLLKVADGNGDGIPSTHGTLVNGVPVPVCGVPIKTGDELGFRTAQIGHYNLGVVVSK